MQITLFGGSFNPPHLGHLFVIQQAFELIPDLNELWILPCYKHTFQKHLVDSYHRIQMTKLLIKQLPPHLSPRVKLETVEIAQRLSGETFETIKILNRKYPKHNFSFLMGTDQLQSFTKWGNWQKLIKIMPFYIYPRNGYASHIRFPNMKLLKSPTQIITNLSSQLIRQRIKQSLALDHLLAPSIIEYIKKNNLYD